MKNPVFLVTVAALLFLVLLSGCSAPLSPGGLRPAEGTTRPSGSDAEFVSVYDQSSKELLEEMRIVNSRFQSAAVNAGQVYSPATLRQAALDMKETADSYHASLLALEDFSSRETEIRRNDYLGYLSELSFSGSSIAEAAAAESTGQYALAVNYAGLAGTSLDRIEGIPNQELQHEIEVMKVQLEDYAWILREKLTE